MTDHALCHQPRERFGHIQHATGLQRPREKPRIKQMQHRMLDPADILIHRQPAFRRRRIDALIPAAGCIAREIPAGFKKRIERIRLPLRRVAAARAVHLFPARVMRQRVAGLIECHILRQRHRQLCIRHRHRAAIRTMNNRNRRPPIALAADTPIPQPVIDLALADTACFKLRNRRFLGLCHRKPIEQQRIHQHAIAGIGQFQRRFFRTQIGRNRLERIAFRRARLQAPRHRHARINHLHNRQPIFRRELEVPLIMRRAAEHRPRAIIHQHEIRDIDRMLKPRQRINRFQPRIKPLLLRLLDRLFRRPQRATFLDERLQRRLPRRQRFTQRMVRRNRYKTHAIQRIRPRRINTDFLIAVRKCNIEQRPARFADPFLLHQPHFFRPVFEGT